MKDTGGNEIPEVINGCDCGLTSGCEKCNPFIKAKFIGCISDEEANEAKEFLKDWKQRFNEDFKKRNKRLFEESNLNRR